jgi:hypothetical protein
MTREMMAMWLGVLGITLAVIAIGLKFSGIDNCCVLP